MNGNRTPLLDQFEGIVASFRGEIDYEDPEERPDEGKDNDAIYELIRAYFQRKWSRGSLLEALRQLSNQQWDIGFLPDISQTQHFRFLSPDKRAYLLALYNPLRAERSKGSGRKVAPAGLHIRDEVDTKCYLCTRNKNLVWQNKNVQLYYEFCINGRAYVAACNPFPISSAMHITIAFASHEPQDLAESKTYSVETKIRLLVEDIYQLAAELQPQGVIMFNGASAGATINHYHLHALEPIPGQPDFPLQVAAQSAHPYGSMPDIFKFGGDGSYPLVAFRLYGADAVENTIKLMLKWFHIAGENATANLLALTEAGQTTLYFVPRHKAYSVSTKLKGLIAGLEELGQVVLSTAEEKQSVDNKIIDYTYLWDALADVLPPGVDQLTI